MRERSKIRNIRRTFFSDFQRYAKHFSESGFAGKLGRIKYVVGRELLMPMLRLYYVFKAPSTPLRKKMYILGALGYFILPLDFVPDFLLPAIGYADDLVVATTVINIVSKYCTPEVDERAHIACDKLLKPRADNALFRAEKGTEHK